MAALTANRGETHNAPHQVDELTAHSHDAAPIAGPAAGQADTGPSLLAACS
jgi:hypothetical protein